MSQGAAGRSAQCHMLFARAGTASLVGRTPWSARDALVPLFSGEEPAGGPAVDQGIGVKISRRTPPYVVDGRNRVSKILRSGRHILTPIADQGVRPTAYAGVSRTQKYAASGRSARATSALVRYAHYRTSGSLAKYRLTAWSILDLVMRTERPSYSLMARISL